MKQILMCKGCEYLEEFSHYTAKGAMRCSIDHKLKGSQKEGESNCWWQCSNRCPLKRYIIRGGKNATFKNKICPKCGKKIIGYPGLSRVDNKTEICSKCGQIEALEDWVEHRR